MKKHKQGMYDLQRGYLKVTVKKRPTPYGLRWMCLIGNAGWICDSWDDAFARALREAYGS